jgi:hypothetical protein
MYSVEPSPYGGGFYFKILLYISLMKELIYVTAHCTEEAQEKELEKCIDSILGFGRDIALISHTHIPPHIQKKCQYYFYDHLNDVTDNVDLLGFVYYKFNDGKEIQSKFFHKTFYGFAIYRMNSIASQIAKMFGYDIIHHLEYDCQILDKNLIDKHSELLQTYDSVFYTETGDEKGFMMGSFKSFKVSKLPELFSDFNRDELGNEMRKLKQIHLENFTRNLFVRQGNYCILHMNEITSDNFSRGKNFESRNIHYTLFYDSTLNTLNLFYNSLYKDEVISITINNKEIFSFESKKGLWRRQNLGNFDRVNHVKIDNGNKIIYKKTFDSNFKEVFKVNSFIIHEKNN